MQAFETENKLNETQSRVVYIIEDDPDVQAVLSYNLKGKGFHVRCFSKGEELIELLDSTTSMPSAMIVDVNLAGSMNGIEAVNFVRAKRKTAGIPVLMLTAKGENKDIVRGLNEGADDYIPKPFDMDVLFARLNSIIRRKEHPAGAVPQAKNRVSLAEIEIDPVSHEVWVQGKPMQLTMTEFGILSTLMTRPNEVFNRDDLLIRVMGPNKTVTERTIDVHVRALRAKLAKKARHIFTVRGLGYKFVP